MWVWGILAPLIALVALALAIWACISVSKPKCRKCKSKCPGSSSTSSTTGSSGGVGDFAYVYALVPQTVPTGGAVLFDANGPITSGFTHALGSSSITIVNAGTYDVTFSVSGTEPNQFALYLNGVELPDTVYGSGAGTQQNTGQAIFVAAAGDVLTLVNPTSAAAVTLASNVGGTQANVTASVKLLRLR